MNVIVYEGRRDPDGEAHVLRDGKPLPHREPKHSPDGFEWGYAGSGPADLARALLREHLGYFPHPAIYQRLKDRCVQSLPHDQWALTDRELQLHVEAIRAELNIRCLRCMDRGFLDLGGAWCVCEAGTLAKRECADGE